MPFPLGRRLAPLTTLLTLGLLVGVLGVPSASATDEPVLPAVSEPAASADALTAVEAILDGGGGEGRDLTMELRDLRLKQGPTTTFSRASRESRRPITDMFADFGPVRVHYLSTDTKATPAWINLVGATTQQVLATYAAAGYRPPKPDGNRGGSSQLDVYVLPLERIDKSLYGFCDADKSPPRRGPSNVSSFCVLDNDYAGFPGTPEQTLQVTAAHELFHAVQFAYDYEEDRWLLEATATWVEDELYTDVNDNRQYLAASPMRQPRQSLDQYVGLRHYGEWIFFRYLTERWPAEQGGMPVLVRRLMERVDGARGGPNLYSIRAIERELRSRGTNLKRVYAEFSVANRRPQHAYQEGAAYRAAPPSKRWTLSGKRRDTGVQQTRLDHLASATMRFSPGAGLRKNKRLRVHVDLPRRSTGAAVVSTYRANGRVRSQFVRLDGKGRGHATVRFDSRRIDWVEVTLVNASTRYQCWQGTVRGVQYSCEGIPLDDRQQVAFRARAIR